MFQLILKMDQRKLIVYRYILNKLNNNKKIKITKFKNIDLKILDA